MSLSIALPVRSAKPSRNIVESVVLGIALTALSYVVGMSFGWISSVNGLEAFAVFTSYMSTYLCVMERRFNYVAGAISTAAYCVLFLQTDLLASATVNAYLVFTLAYGWWRWRDDSNTRPVSRIQLKWLPVYALVTGVAYVGALALNSAVGGTMALTDTIILVGTILAQFLLDNKKLATWSVWAIVNVFAIYTYFHAGLALAGFQYIFFLANTVWGWHAWKQSMNKSNDIAKPERELVSA